MLTSHEDWSTWTMDRSEDKTLPITCVSWYEAMAFCVWDGGRLPTEAEWEYAAAGGDENRLYPWDPLSAPEDDCLLANWPGCGVQSPRSVGLTPDGAARWGHQDLAGNVWEWVFDWYDSGWYDEVSTSDRDVANLTEAHYRVIRGGSFNYAAAYHRVAERNGGVPPADHFGAIGFRCARIR